MTMASTDPSLLAGLSVLLRAPSKDALVSLFDTLFRQRHGTEEERVASVQALLSLSAEDASALTSSAGAVLRRALYESSELLSVDAVRVLLPPALDGRLLSLVSTVRCAAHFSPCRARRCMAHPTRLLLPPPPSPAHTLSVFTSLGQCTLPLQVLFSGLQGWREAAVEQRVGLPHLEGVSWNVLAVNSNSSTSSANEAALKLKLSLRDQPSQEGVMPASRDVYVAVSPASLGAMLEGMRKVKEQLAQFS